MSVGLLSFEHQNNKENDIVLAALNIIIDGIASSEVSTETKCAANYIAGLVMADNKGILDPEKQKAILCIFEMAFEVGSVGVMAN
ncbi:hypothetical protein EIJ81_06830 [Aliivibrio salmonicida]|uniref:Uncharacterized protein n=1 Tax=Aliivibrio salmonicida (strain LFI1238) TaxID=316275 RepID=B6EIR4_ALISL|nr:hypothetical protein [Aliivibrio salmonicida]AZL84364.1 hypothetical protein EIJ81_06830 [Aliivibrio salmonicida]CAQ78708.1 hypothetical protein, putative phage gene [Aliivibrio salmonicida LFI1238]